ncbi:unnamed protein product [Parnassius mnemosyne]|uniref:Reverse transcriptase domain-containing protein n=1 Tax=Parnassius mnemosyne TaxID=213953 RepID=A0AAV1KJN7_9NEOP
MEHLVKNRLEWILENRGILSRTQFGFRKGFSTMDSLSILVSDIRLAFSNNEYLVGVFVDVRSAYDDVILPLLRQKMQQLNIPERITNFVSNLLSQRRILVRSEGKLTSPRPVWKGLPQGSVLSPLLYSLYTYELDRSVNYLANVLQYADDLVLYASDISFDQAISRLSQAVKFLNFWLIEHGLSISASKSNSVVFTRRRFSPDVPIHIDDSLIPSQTQVKFLGVFLDSKMTWWKRVRRIANRSIGNGGKEVNVRGKWVRADAPERSVVFGRLWGPSERFGEARGRRRVECIDRRPRGVALKCSASRSASPGLCPTKMAA